MFRRAQDGVSERSEEALPDDSWKRSQNKIQGGEVGVVLGRVL